MSALNQIGPAPRAASLDMAGLLELLDTLRLHANSIPDNSARETLATPRCWHCCHTDEPNDWQAWPFILCKYSAPPFPSETTAPFSQSSSLL